MNETMANSKNKVMKYLRVMALVTLGYVSAVLIHLVAPGDVLGLPPECVVLYNYAESFREKSNFLEEQNRACLDVLMEARQQMETLQCSEEP